MRKLEFTFVLLALFFLVLGSTNAFQKIERFPIASKTNSNLNASPLHEVKYDDCIKEADFPKKYLLYTHEITNQHLDWDFAKVNESVQKYAKSLDSTLKNLSTVDAHDFIHQTFQKAKAAVEKEGVSEIQRHYYGEIMRFCFTRDKYLSQNNAGIL